MWKLIKRPDGRIVGWDERLACPGADALDRLRGCQGRAVGLAGRGFWTFNPEPRHGTPGRGSQRGRCRESFG